MASDVGTDKKRLIALMLALALALALTASVFSGPAGRSASARSNTPPLSIAAAVNPQPVFVGLQVNLYVEETNNTNSTFPEVAVRDWLPNGTAYVSATPTQGECFYAASVHNVFHEKAHFVKANVVGDCSDLRGLPVVMLPSALSL